MSGQLPYTANGASNTPSSSLRRTPLGNQRSKVSNGDRRPQSCAEFHGKSKKALPSYANSHQCFDENSTTAYYRRDDKPESLRYVKREVLPLPAGSRKTGIVGPEPDYSVRVRNLPIIFCKQLRHAAQHFRMVGNHPVWKTIELCFLDPDRTLYGKERPNAGCHQTRRWSDAQVKAWTQLANWLGIHFLGDREYQFPKYSLGYARYGGYHHNDSTLAKFPWPGTEHSRVLEPFKLRIERSKVRSEFSRIKRSLLRGSKEVVVKPLDFSTLLTQKRVLSHRRIAYLWNLSGRQCSFQQYKESVPYVLAVNLPIPPAQVPPIVVESLKKLARRVSRLVPSLPVVSETKPSYGIKIPVIPSDKQQKKSQGRLTAYLSADGNVYVNRAKTGNSHIFAGSQDALRPDKRGIIDHAEALRIEREQQSYLDNYGDEYDGPATLGSWSKGDFSLGDWDL